MGMELFRVDGISSADLLRGGTGDHRRFLGTMFRMEDGTPPQPQVVPPVMPPAPGIDAGDGKNSLGVDPLGRDPKDHRNDEKHIDGGKRVVDGKRDDGKQEEAGDRRLYEKDLKILTKEKLQEAAAALGIADISVSKEKLIEAILAAQ